MSEPIKERPVDSETKYIPTGYPRNVLRIVMQVKDTPENQVAMRNALEALRQIEIPDASHAVIKGEQIHMLVGCVTASATNKDKDKP